MVIMHGKLLGAPIAGSDTGRSPAWVPYFHCVAQALSPDEKLILRLFFSCDTFLLLTASTDTLLRDYMSPR